MAITLSILTGFSKFVHCYKENKIFNSSHGAGSLSLSVFIVGISQYRPRAYSRNKFCRSIINHYRNAYCNRTLLNRYADKQISSVLFCHAVMDRIISRTNRIACTFPPEKNLFESFVVFCATVISITSLLSIFVLI